MASFNVTSPMNNIASHIFKVDKSIGPYDYVPSKSVGIVFVTLFSISTVLHFFQSIYFRVWWMLPTAVLCGIAELVGWSARLYSSGAPSNSVPFEIQISSTIIAPTPLIAANFIMLGRIIRTLGTQYSRLGPKLYTTIFLACDIVSLTIQGTGGALAAIASSDGRNPDSGGHIMLGGIVIQMVAITAYVICASEFMLRHTFDKPLRTPAVNDKTSLSSTDCGIDSRSGMDSRTKILIYAMSFNTVCLVIRSIYRTIELTDGWNGIIIATQVYFNVFDAGMVTLAIFTYNFFHPGYLSFAPKPRVQA